MADEMFVVITEPNKSPRRIVLEGSVEFGRECEGELVDDGEVSRRHLKLLPSPNGLKVIDLGSSNGTTVNGVRITEPTTLKAGDVIRLGRTELAVGEPPPPPPPAPERTTAAPQPVSRNTMVAPEPAAPAQPARRAPAAEAKPAAPVSTAAVKPRFMATISAMTSRILDLERRHPLRVLWAFLGGTFFLVVLTGALKQVDANALELKSASAVLPAAIVLAVAGISRARYLAAEVQHGFLDRLLLSTSRRLPILIGCMIADFIVGIIVAIPLVLVGLALGLHFATGIGGIAVIIVLAGAWAAVYGGLWYAIALGTGNPEQARLEYGLIFALLLLSPSLVPRDAMSPWLRHLAAFNPLTYPIEAIRALQTASWDSGVLIKAAIAVVIVGVITLTVGGFAVRSRVRATMASGPRSKRPPKATSAASPAQSEADMLRAALEAEREARLRLEERLAQGQAHG